MDEEPQPSTSRGPGQTTEPEPDPADERGPSTEPGLSEMSTVKETSGASVHMSSASDITSSSSSSAPRGPPRHHEFEKFILDRADLRSRLTDLQFTVTQNRGIEMPYSGDYLYTGAPGTYCCLICDAELFSSESKYDALCGWPCWWDVIDEERICLIPDRDRHEVSCVRCESHLGHVYDDDLTPTCRRYVINSCALSFRAADASDSSSPSDQISSATSDTPSSAPSEAPWPRLPEPAPPAPFEPGPLPPFLPGPSAPFGPSSHHSLPALPRGSRLYGPPSCLPFDTSSSSQQSSSPPEPISSGTSYDKSSVTSSSTTMSPVRSEPLPMRKDKSIKRNPPHNSTHN